MIVPDENTSYRRILIVAWPIILSSISVPLLALVDTAVIGNLGDAALLGAIAIGGMIFNFIYWGFGFLRMGTTGLIAQEVGREHWLNVRAILYRAGLLGILIGVSLVLTQSLIASAAFSIIDGSHSVESAAMEYFQIRILGAPISLANLAIIGFLLGCQDTRGLLVIQVSVNLINIVLDLLFVVVFNMNVTGVALASVLAEIFALGLGMIFVAGQLRRQGLSIRPAWVEVWQPQALFRMLAVNRDIMIRTLSLTFGFAWFTNQGAAGGDITLAANTVLIQFVTFSAFFLDGIALAAETLVGQAIGARRRRLVERIIVLSTHLSIATAIMMAIVIYLTGNLVISVLTNVVQVREFAAIYFLWVVAAPLISVWCYLLDGVFIGATRTAEMRNAMVASLAIYLVIWWLTKPFENHGLWLSLMAYYVARSLTLFVYLPRLIRGVEEPKT